MLTKSDLNQIGNVVDEKLEPVKKDIKYLKKKVNRIDKTLDLVVKKYDEEDVRVQKRVKRIETHLGLTPLPQQ